MKKRLPEPPIELWFLAERTATRDRGEDLVTQHYLKDVGAISSHIAFLEKSTRTLVKERRLWKLTDGRWVEHDVFVTDTRELQYVGGPKQ